MHKLTRWSIHILDCLGGVSVYTNVCEVYYAMHVAYIVYAELLALSIDVHHLL